MKIGNIDLDKKVLVIAEIGNNHEGVFALAKRMVCEAAQAGADAVKFQTFRTDKYITISERERYKQLIQFELTYEQFKELSSIARENGILFLSTPFDVESANIIDAFVPAFKVSSGDNTFWPLIKNLASKGKPVILSTGMTDEREIRGILGVLKKNRQEEPIEEWVALLHCVSCYPVPYEEANLLSIKYLRDVFGLTVGYSDHTLGTTACLAAVALGARIIEKHFTYKRKGQKFRDHLLSAEPEEFKEMVEKIRQVESCIGEYKKSPMPCEEGISRVLRRSIAANKPIRKGEMIGVEDLTWVRPASGLHVGHEELVIGRKAVRNIQKGEIIGKEDIR